MKCSGCDHNKPPYHFFYFRGHYDRSFFTRPIEELNGLCFVCAAPYRCLKCGKVRPAGSFRIGGRLCQSCRMHRRLKPQAISAVLQQ